MAMTLFALSVAAAAGTVGTAPNANASASAAKAARQAEFLAKHYPPEALSRGEQGKVGFQLTIEKDGTPLSCAITQSSGFHALDAGTCEFIVRFGRMTPSKDASGMSVRATKTGYINWKLPERTLALAETPAAGKAGAKGDTLVCRRTSVPGSIIKKVRRCMTTAEWKKNDSETMQQMDEVTGAYTCGDHGC
jgi:protein TonB